MGNCQCCDEKPCFDGLVNYAGYSVKRGKMVFTREVVLEKEVYESESKKEAVTTAVTEKQFIQYQKFYCGRLSMHDFGLKAHLDVCDEHNGQCDDCFGLSTDNMPESAGCCAGFSCECVQTCVFDYALNKKPICCADVNYDGYSISLGTENYEMEISQSLHAASASTKAEDEVKVEKTLYKKYFCGKFGCDSKQGKQCTGCSGLTNLDPPTKRGGLIPFVHKGLTNCANGCIEIEHDIISSPAWDVFCCFTAGCRKPLCCGDVNATGFSVKLSQEEIEDFEIIVDKVKISDPKNPKKILLEKEIITQKKIVKKIKLFVCGNVSTTGEVCGEKGYLCKGCKILKLTELPPKRAGFGVALYSCCNYIESDYYEDVQQHALKVIDALEHSARTAADELNAALIENGKMSQIALAKSKAKALKLIRNMSQYCGKCFIPCGVWCESVEYSLARTGRNAIGDIEYELHEVLPQYSNRPFCCGDVNAFGISVYLQEKEVFDVEIVAENEKSSGVEKLIEKEVKTESARYVCGLSTPQGVCGQGSYLCRGCKIVYISKLPPKRAGLAVSLYSCCCAAEHELYDDVHNKSFEVVLAVEQFADKTKTKFDVAVTNVGLRSNAALAKAREVTLASIESFNNDCSRRSKCINVQLVDKIFCLGSEGCKRPLLCSNENDEGYAVSLMSEKIPEFVYKDVVVKENGVIKSSKHTEFKTGEFVYAYCCGRSFGSNVCGQREYLCVSCKKFMLTKTHPVLGGCIGSLVTHCGDSEVGMCPCICGCIHKVGDYVEEFEETVTDEVQGFIHDEKCRVLCLISLEAKLDIEGLDASMKKLSYEVSFGPKLKKRAKETDGGKWVHDAKELAFKATAADRHKEYIALKFFDHVADEKGCLIASGKRFFLDTRKSADVIDVEVLQTFDLFDAKEQKVGTATAKFLVKEEKFLDVLKPVKPIEPAPKAGGGGCCGGN